LIYCIWTNFPFLKIKSLINPLRKFIDTKGYLILDGGLASLLEDRGHILDSPLWSAQLLKNNPIEIKKVHTLYLEAGADCIISSSYQLSHEGGKQVGLTNPEVNYLLQKSINLARQAVKEFDLVAKPRFTPLVAASIGPYGAFLADGAEYKGNYNVSRTELKDFHEERWNILANSGADLMACETIPSFQEAEVLKDLLIQKEEVFAFFSFSCKDEETINDGTPISKCAEFLSGQKRLLAIGVNCTAPEYIDGLIREVKKGAPDIPVIVYPNSGEKYNGESGQWEGTTRAESIQKNVKVWLESGARIIGGCCRTSPETISSIKEALINQ
jgi:homocysteine S-methyltransferase